MAKRDRLGVSTGSPTRDAMLVGGYLGEGTVQLTDIPGSGKRTLAMQFPQDGLDNGETGFFIGAEQTVDELRNTFTPSGFDLATSYSRSRPSTPGRA